MKQIGSVLTGLVIGFFFSSSLAQAAPQWFSCTPNQVATYANRVHVRCTTGVNGVLYFAVNANNTAIANRILSVGSTALVSGRNLDVNFDAADLSGSSYGCGNQDCRPILGLAIK